MSGLWLGGLHRAYFGIIQYFAIDPFAHPFDDTDTVMSALRCLRAGVDVYTANPCDPELRIYDYSPLWLELARLPVTGAWLNPAGLVVDGLFIGSLLLLPPARDARGAVLVAFGAVASQVMFAVERGNNDLVVFVLAVAAAWLLARSARARVLGYGALMLAALLKYYPLLAMGVAFRERASRFFAVAAAAVAIVVLFALIYRHDLPKALALIPVRSPMANPFGAVNIAMDMGVLFDTPKATQAMITHALTAIALVLGLVVARKASTGAALAALRPAETTSLVIGALVCCGCFFAAQNISYRQMQLLIALPALTVIAATPEAKGLRRLLVTALLMLWADFWREHLIALGGAFGGREGSLATRLVVSAIRESLWWWQAVMFLGLAMRLAMDSEVGRMVLGAGPLRLLRPASAASEPLTA